MSCSIFTSFSTQADIMWVVYRAYESFVLSWRCSLTSIPIGTALKCALYRRWILFELVWGLYQINFNPCSVPLSPLSLPFWLEQSVALIGLQVFSAWGTNFWNCVNVMRLCVVFSREVDRSRVCSFFMNIDSFMSWQSYFHYTSSFLFVLWWSWSARTFKSMMWIAMESLAASR